LKNKKPKLRNPDTRKAGQSNALSYFSAQISFLGKDPSGVELPIVQNEGTTETVILNFGIPRGATGAAENLLFLKIVAIWRIGG